MDESPAADESPLALAHRLARVKALSLGVRPNSVVLAADTVVSREGRLYPKPRGAGEAVRMLRELRGQRHEVTTGVCVASPGQDLLLGAVRTAVWMRDYAEDDIAGYVASGNPFDKAGGYAIQDRTFHLVDRFEGCYSNVVGLPLCLTSALLRRAGLRMPRGANGCEHGAI